MNILLLGSGGREHALAWKITQSPLCDALYIAPGNAGTAELGMNIDLDILHFEKVAEVVSTHQIDLLVVGPEEPLVRGIRDYFTSNDDLMIVGPGKDGAILEGSKAYAKEFMAAAGIPTASYASFQKGQADSAITFLQTMSAPYVIKADGLAAGKGVIITSDLSEAETTVREMLEGSFGDAGLTVVLESFLDGIEYSAFVMCDGANWQLLPVAKDYKRVGEGDTGPNTGGMGAISPVPFFTEDLRQKTIDRIIQPTVDELQKRGINYKGFIFIGLIRVGDDPYVIEYNCRMGDPETEVVMPMLKSDLVPLLVAMDQGTLNDHLVEMHEGFTCTVMLCSGGYPGAYNKGKAIQIPEQAEQSLLFHAGTKRDESGQLVTNGGRVMALSSQGEDVATALVHSMELAEAIKFEGKFYRKDIGFDL